MSIIEILEKIPLFSEMDKADLNKIKEVLKEKRYSRDESIFFETDLGDIFYIVYEGRVKIYNISLQGQVKILDFLGKGDFFGEMALIDEMPRSANALAVEDTVLLTISHSEFQQFLQKQPDILFKITKTLCRRLRKADLEIELMAFGDVKSRLVSCLLNIIKKYGIQKGGSDIIPPIFTHKDLSEIVGTSREVISRILKQLKEDKLIKIGKKREILIPSSAALEKLLKESH